MDLAGQSICVEGGWGIQSYEVPSKLLHWRLSHSSCCTWLRVKCHGTPKTPIYRTSTVGITRGV